MASPGNFHYEETRALKHNTVSLTTADGVITYTAKTGRSADDFIIDKFIRVTSTDSYNMTITLPDGVAYGQDVWVLFEVEGSAETVDVTPSTGDSGTTLTGAGGYNHFVWCGSTIGWALVASSAT